LTGIDFGQLKISGGGRAAAARAAVCCGGAEADATEAAQIAEAVASAVLRGERDMGFPSRLEV
jgi:hypothetical protein